MDVIVRRMQPRDRQAVQQIARKSWRETYRRTIPSHIQQRFLKYAYSDESLKKRLLETLFIVAIVEHKIVGFANFSPAKPTGESELGALYLLPTYQRKGIGTSLLKHGIKKLPNSKEIILYVERNNEIGIKFYKASGFKKVKEMNDYIFTHPVQTIQMSLVIQS